MKDETKIKLAAMDAANQQCAIDGESPKYSEEDFMKLLEPSETQAAEEPKPWRPPEGEWYVNACGNTKCFKTKEDAKEQAELTKGWLWLCALARHVNPSERCMKPMEKGYAVRLVDLGNSFSWSGQYEGITTVFENQKAAEEAIEIMNRDKDRWKEIVG